MKMNFEKNNGLVPVVIQDYKSNEVLMLGFMNQEAYEKTLGSKWVWFWSRSRKKLWMKGADSGNKLKVKKILIDCDNDTLLIKAELMGNNVCHTGSKSCFEEAI